MTTINRIQTNTHEYTFKNNNVNYYVSTTREKKKKTIMLLHKMCIHVSAYKSSKKFMKTRENYQLYVCSLTINEKSINHPKIVTKSSNYELLLLLLLLLILLVFNKVVGLLHIEDI